MGKTGLIRDRSYNKPFKKLAVLEPERDDFREGALVKLMPLAIIMESKHLHKMLGEVGVVEKAFETPLGDQVAVKYLPERIPSEFYKSFMATGASTMVFPKEWLSIEGMAK